MKQAASKFLREQRDSIKARDPSRLIQLPSCPKGKHDPAVAGARAAPQKARQTTKYQPTNLSHQENADDINEEDHEEMEAYFLYLCETYDEDPSKSVFDEDFTRSSMEELNTPSSGELTSDLASPKELGGNMKRKSAFSVEPMTNDLSDDADHGHKRRKLEKEIPGSSTEELDDYALEMAKAIEDELLRELQEQELRKEMHEQKLQKELHEQELRKELHEQELGKSTILSESNHTEEISQVTKRKRESTSSLEPPTEDSSDHGDRDSKRMKLEIGTESVQVSTSTQPKKRRGEGPSKLEHHNLFCRNSSLTAVNEAPVGVDALETPQVDSSDSSGLDAIDLELLGEEKNDGEQEQTQPSVNEDHRVAKAAA